MLERLFVYGTLAPGQANERFLKDVPGQWESAIVTGMLFEKGWGAALGYPGIVLHPDYDEVKGLLFSSVLLHRHWDGLDEFEGDGYVRVVTAARRMDGSTVKTWVYALSQSPADTS